MNEQAFYKVSGVDTGFCTRLPLIRDKLYERQTDRQTEKETDRQRLTVKMVSVSARACLAR